MKMEKLIKIFISLIFISVTACCFKKNNDKKSIIIDNIKNHIDTKLKITEKPIVLDVLDVDSLKIRNHKLLNMNLKLFNKKWIKMDSIKQYYAETGDLEGKHVQLFYINGIEFEAYDNKVNLISIDFTKNNEKIIHPKIILDKNTIIDSLKIFNNSYKNKVYDKNNDVIEMKFHTKEGWDDCIFLIFENKRLVNFYFYDFF